MHMPRESRFKPNFKRLEFILFKAREQKGDDRLQNLGSFLLTLISMEATASRHGSNNAIKEIGQSDKNIIMGPSKMEPRP